MPSFTSKTVPTSRTSMSARSAAWISLRRRFFSSPGRRMESVAMGYRLRDCEKYHMLKGGGRRRRAAKGRQKLYTRPGSSSEKTSKDATGTEFAQLHRRGSRYAPRRARQVAGRRIAE